MTLQPCVTTIWAGAGNSNEFPSKCPTQCLELRVPGRLKAQASQSNTRVCRISHTK